MTETVILWVLGAMISVITLLGVAMGRTVWGRTEENREMISDNQRELSALRQQCSSCTERLARAEERGLSIGQRLDAICRSMDDLHKKLDGLRDRVLLGRTGGEG